MQIKLLAATLGILYAMPALAADVPVSQHTFSSNVSLVSDYLYRGISQSGSKPAIQGGFDYAHASGFYAGVWGSSISWLTDAKVYTGATTAPLELDTYLGFKNSFMGDYSYDVGFLRYNYPASYDATLGAAGVKGDTNEIYGSIGWKWLTAKYSYSLGDTFSVPQAKGSNYVDLSVNYPVPDTGIMLGAHYGKQTFKGPNSNVASYSDYKLSISKDISGFVLGLAYSNTNADKTWYVSDAGKLTGKSAVVLSLARTF